MRAADCGGDQYPVVQEDMVRAYVYTVEFGSALNPRGDACILAMHACPPLLLLAQQVAFSLRPAPCTRRLHMCVDPHRACPPRPTFLPRLPLAPLPSLFQPASRVHDGWPTAAESTCAWLGRRSLLGDKTMS
jgi:hypothetical protein